MTCLVAFFDLKEPTLTCTNAGHPPIMIFGDGGMELLDCGGLPVEMFASSTYGWQTLGLCPGDIGFQVTDDINEAVAQNGVRALKFSETDRRDP